LPFFLLCAVFLASCSLSSPPKPRYKPPVVMGWPDETWQLSTPGAHGLDAQAITALAGGILPLIHFAPPQTTPHILGRVHLWDGCSRARSRQRPAQLN
jgi:hypothetical protein